MSYHQFVNDEGEEYGSFETFYIDSAHTPVPDEVGHYWQACFPGCIPDGEPVGPFATEEDAIKDARSD